MTNFVFLNKAYKFFVRKMNKKAMICKTAEFFIIKNSFCNAYCLCKMTIEKKMQNSFAWKNPDPSLRIRFIFICLHR